MSANSPKGGHHAIRAVARLRRPPPVAGHTRQLPRWPSARNKGLRYPPDPPTVEEIIHAVHERPMPMIPATARLAAKR